MRLDWTTLALAALMSRAASAPTPNNDHDHEQHIHAPHYEVSYGPRPYYIIQNMTESSLKDKLASCENTPGKITGWSIGHRGGGTLMFPEETVESTRAGARMSAGILECDVSFTSDRGLVCRHSCCDLHTTTNILLHPDLAKKCTVPSRRRMALPQPTRSAAPAISRSLNTKPSAANKMASTQVLKTSKTINTEHQTSGRSCTTLAAQS